MAYSRHKGKGKGSRRKGGVSKRKTLRGGKSGLKYYQGGGKF